MLRIHTACGRTDTFDLHDEVQAKALVEELGQYAFQRAISGVTLAETHVARTFCQACGQKCSGPIGMQFSVSRPQEFHDISFVAETVEANGRVHGGERLTVYSDDIRLVVMAHAAQPAVRVVMSRIGKRRFDPGLVRDSLVSDAR